MQQSVGFGNMTDLMKAKIASRLGLPVNMIFSLKKICHIMATIVGLALRKEFSNVFDPALRETSWSLKRRWHSVLLICSVFCSVCVWG